MECGLLRRRVTTYGAARAISSVIRQSCLGYRLLERALRGNLAGSLKVAEPESIRERCQNVRAVWKFLAETDIMGAKKKRNL